MDHQSVFTFELDESLRFKKGQEVMEMIHISLEPEISIQELQDHISIRGVMELKGAYYVATDIDEQEVIDTQEILHDRYLNTEEQEEGVHTFVYEFPVEIAIPSERIQQLDEITVEIESFDYELPEQSQIRLNATVAIHGIDNSPQTERQEVVDEDENLEIESEQLEEDTFRLELVEPEKPKIPNQIKSYDLSDEEPKEIESGRWPYKKSQSFASFFGNTTDEESIDVSDSIEPIESIESMESIEPIDSVDSPESIEMNQEPILESPDINRDQHTDLSSIVSLFDSEETSYTRLRMCIVQEGETLQSIADRYDISMMVLSQTNAIEGNDVIPGQILYIPNRRKKEKNR